MGFIVSVYEFEKRRNSTKVPADTDLIATMECLLLDPSDILNPNLRFDAVNKQLLSTCNYAFIAEFDRYYWVDSWTLEGPFITAHCSVDVMASWKTSIGESSQFINRSTTLYDGSLMDNFYPSRANITHITVDISVPWATKESDGRYIIGIIGRGSAYGIGPITYFSMTSAQFKTFCDTLFTNQDWANIDFTAVNDGLNSFLDALSNGQAVPPQSIDITNIATEVFKSQFNPFQYITTCIWIPFTPGGAVVNRIPFGWWSLDVTATLIAPTTGEDLTSFTVSIPKHPLSGSRGKYLNMSPYSSYSLSIAPFGTIIIDNAAIQDVNNLIVNVTCDEITGIAYLRICDSSDNEIHRADAQMGVPIPLASLVTDYKSNPIASVVSGGAAMVGSVARELLPGRDSALVANVAGAVGDVAAAMNSKLQTSGSQGSFGVYKQPAVLTAEFVDINKEDINRFGRPYLGFSKINELSGFVSCMAPTVDFKCYYNERLAIENYLVEGFYYE